MLSTEVIAALEQRLKAAEDREAILAVAYRFNVLVNYGGTLEEWGAVLTDDARVTVSSADGVQLADDRGVEAIRSARPPKPGRRAANLLLGPILQIDGDEATLESYWSVLADTDDGPRVAMYGRARNAFVRTGAGWRVKARDAEVESSAPRKDA